MTAYYGKSTTIWFYVLAILLISPIHTSADGLLGRSQQQYSYKAPERLDDGWTVEMLIKHIIPAFSSPATSMPVAQINSNILKKYVGKYYFKRMNLTLNIFIENETLKLHDRQKDKDEIIDLWPESETMFRGTSNDVGDIQLAFITDDKNKTTHFYVHGGFGFTRLKFEKTDR